MKNTKLEICTKCWGTGHVHGGDENSTWSKSCEDCRGLGFVRVPKTNADRIRDMTDEELAAYLLDISTAECPFKEVRCDIYTDKTCAKCWGDWLKDPVKEDGADENERTSD